MTWADDNVLRAVTGSAEGVGAGSGIASYASWLIAVAVLLGLVGLAWWSLRPARRATRAELRQARRRRGSSPRDLG